MNATRVQRARMHGLFGLCVVLALGLAALPARAQQIVVFEAHGPKGGQYEGDIDIYAQCLSASGELLGNDGDPVPVMAGAYIERVGAVLPDGSGGVIVIAEAVARDGEYAGDWEIVAQRVSADGRRLWRDGERLVGVAATTWLERHPIGVPDGRGGVFVVYEAEAPSDSEWAGDIDVRGQHLSAAGELLWQEGGVAIDTSDALEQAPCAVADGAGGAIVGFQCATRQGPYAGDWEIGAQRVSVDGRLLWEEGERAMVVMASEWRETRPVMVADGTGGALVFCQAKGAAGSRWEGDSDVLGQRITADGRRLWANGAGAIGVHNSDVWEDAPVAVPDGNGGAVVICSATPRSGEFAGNWAIVAQRISMTGQLLWHNGERPSVVAATALDERRPCAAPDGAGGVYVACEGRHPAGSENGGDVDLLAQRLGPDGRALWAEEGGVLVVSGSSHLECAPWIATDGQGGAIITFEVASRDGEHAGDRHAVARRLGPDGVAPWNGGETAVIVCASEWDERTTVIMGDGVGVRDTDDYEAGGTSARIPHAPMAGRFNPSTPQGTARPATAVATKARR